MGLRMGSLGSGPFLLKTLLVLTHAHARGRTRTTRRAQHAVAPHGQRKVTPLIRRLCSSQRRRPPTQSRPPHRRNCHCRIEALAFRAEALSAGHGLSVSQGHSPGRKRGIGSSGHPRSLYPSAWARWECFTLVDANSVSFDGGNGRVPLSSRIGWVMYAKQYV